jgi:hypothetical protein
MTDDCWFVQSHGCSTLVLYLFIGFLRHCCSDLVQKLGTLDAVAGCACACIMLTLCHRE